MRVIFIYRNFILKLSISYYKFAPDVHDIQSLKGWLSMVKTLKGRISMIYLSLVLMIGVIGATSVINFYNLSRKMDGLMADNYRSISAANIMLEAIEGEDSAVLTYINIDRQEGTDNFLDNNNTFLKFFEKESDNITEKGEREYVDKINEYYTGYVKLFSMMQEAANSQGKEDVMSFYKTNMVPQLNSLKQVIKELSALNETVMLDNENKATQNAKNSMYTLLILSTLTVICGFSISRFFTNRFLKPIYSLAKTIKSVNEGNLNQKADIIMKDEIGMLTNEFNDMTKRLQDFERSTVGKLMTEKNKSIAIVKSISDPLIVLDNEFKLTLINNAFEKSFRIDEASCLNKHFHEIIENRELFNFISSVSKINEGYKQKIMCIKSVESEYYYNVIVKTIKNFESNVYSIMVLFQNVTELKQLERIKADFISTISHEFKTPLTSVMMAASLISSESMGTLTKKQSDILETMQEDIKRLSSLTNNLIEISKIELGNKVFNIYPCSIYDIIETAVKHMHQQAKLKNINIYHNLDKDLPMINADPEEIEKVIIHLLSDSLKYTNSGDDILISAFVKMKKLCTSVRDTGAYISPEYKDRIFNKYIQAEGHDIEARGTGFGLASVKEIIEAHGGEIWCESMIKTGNEFTFTLPIVDEKAHYVHNKERNGGSYNEKNISS